MLLVRDGDVELRARVEGTAALCHDALREFDDLRLPEQDWCHLLDDYPSHFDRVAQLRELRARTNAAPGRFERFVLIQAALAALPRLVEAPVHRSVKLLGCTMFGHLARPRPQWQDFYTHRWRFQEMTQFVTLRRFAAGQHDWELAGLPRSWLLKTDPLALPGLLKAIGLQLGGFAPLAKLHLSLWRPNPLMVLEGEARRSYWRIARSLELWPEIRGLMASSWFYHRDVGKVSPHLAWLRAFFVENGATVAEMEAPGDDLGFLVGSARRRQAFRSGSFRPRVTLVLWSRGDMLAWARRQPDLEGRES